jgi:hypothetical protein
MIFSLGCLESYSVASRSHCVRCNKGLKIPWSQESGRKRDPPKAKSPINAQVQYCDSVVSRLESDPPCGGGSAEGAT